MNAHEAAVVAERVGLRDCRTRSWWPRRKDRLTDRTRQTLEPADDPGDVTAVQIEDVRCVLLLDDRFVVVFHCLFPTFL